MKTNKFWNLLMVAALVAFMFTGCKKESSSSTPTTATTNAEQTQNSDVQDAVADRSEQDADNTVDQLQANNYVVPSTKTSGSVTITVNHPDSTTFPKTVSIVYSNYQDSTSGEKFVYNGEIDVDITLPPTALGLVYNKRVFTFKSFSITTDSTVITVSGERTVTRISEKFYPLPDFKGLRIVIMDSIDANTTWSITTIGSPDSLHFTREVRRIRTSDINFINVNATAIKWNQIVLITYPHLDTIFWQGTVTGVNEAGDNYTKTITTPLQGTWYDGTPVLIAGEMSLNIATPTPLNFTIMFQRDLPDHPFKTLVTVTNVATGKTWSFDRSFWGRFFRWW